MRRHRHLGSAVLGMVVGAAAVTESRADSPADLGSTKDQDVKARLEARVDSARTVVMRTFEKMLSEGQASKDTLAQWYNWPNWNNWYNDWRNF
jgi:hypothetical protein